MRIPSIVFLAAAALSISGVAQAQTKFELKGTLDRDRTPASVAHACTSNPSIRPVVEVWPDRLTFLASDGEHVSIPYAAPRVLGQPTLLQPFHRVVGSQAYDYSGAISATGIPEMRSANAVTRCAFRWEAQ